MFEDIHFFLCQPYLSYYCYLKLAMIDFTVTHVDASASDVVTPSFHSEGNVYQDEEKDALLLDITDFDRVLTELRRFSNLDDFIAGDMAGQKSVLLEQLQLVRRAALYSFYSNQSGKFDLLDKEFSNLKAILGIASDDSDSDSMNKMENDAELALTTLSAHLHWNKNFLGETVGDGWKPRGSRVEIKPKSGFLTIISEASAPPQSVCCNRTV